MGWRETRRVVLLQRQHCQIPLLRLCATYRKVVGSGNVRVLSRGGLSFVYYTKARFFSNPKAHVRNAAISFSFACHKTTGLSEEIQVRRSEYPVQKEQIAGWVSECKLRKKQRSQLAAPNTKKGALRRRQVEKAVGVKRERQTI